MKGKAPKKKIPANPPKIPTDLEQLERAINLLGNRIKSELQQKARGEIKSLLGVYPSVEEAEIWKQRLKALRKERIETQEQKKEDP